MRAPVMEPRTGRTASNYLSGDTIPFTTCVPSPTTWPVVASTLPRRMTVSCCSKRLRPCLIKEGSERKMEEPFYQILREWIAQGCSLDMESPKVASLQVVPYNPVIRNIGDLQQLRVIARFEDGKTRDVTRECFVETSNSEVATVDPLGLVTSVPEVRPRCAASASGPHPAHQVINPSGIDQAVLRVACPHSTRASSRASCHLQNAQ